MVTLIGKKVFGKHIVAGILMAGLFVITSAQEGLYNLKWIENGSLSSVYDKVIVEHEYLKFEGSVFADGNLLPKYSKSILIPNGSDRKYEIRNLVFESVPDSLLQNIQIPDILPNASPDIKVFQGRNSKYLNISIFPLKWNESHDKLNRLIEFELVSEDNFSEGWRVHSKSIKNEESEFNSLLHSGYWYKVKITERGIYRLSYSDITDMGFSNPAHIRVFGHGGKQLGYMNSDPRPVDLPECPVYMNMGSDNIFNAGDYILFYAEGPALAVYDTTLEVFTQQIHNYSDGIYYFLTTSHGAGNKIETISTQHLIENEVVTTYNEFAWHEENLINLLSSGRTWYSDRFDINPDRTFERTFNFSNINAGSVVNIRAKCAGRSKNVRQTSLSVNDEIVASLNIPAADFRTQHKIYANEEVIDHSFINSNSELKVGVTYNKGDLTDEAYLDYITINARCNLTVNNNPFFFRDVNSIGEDGVARFRISNVSGSVQVWDVTRINDVFAVSGQLSGSTYEFKASSKELREYVLVDLSHSFPRPITDNAIRGVGSVSNQDIRSHSTHNYIIVSPPDFLDQANRLANHHRENSNLSVLVVTPEQIYNEFSSGTPDVSALRDFFKHQYDRGSAENGLKYVLLFGDGSFYNHGYMEGNTNCILTYQSKESLDPIHSFVTDDFFGLLDDNEGEVNGALDIGIGRLPVNKVNEGEIDTEAKLVVDKIISYSESKPADWRRMLCFMGDDGVDGGINDGTIHMRDADSLAEFVKEYYPGFEFKKIFLDAYPQVVSASGPAYPKAKEELLKAFEKGVLVFNYNGHGGVDGITGEKVLLSQDIIAMSNRDVLPLFITGTCQFSKFDKVLIQADNNVVEKKSGGEYALLNPEGGSIALISTTRVVYASSNFRLGDKVFKQLFKKDASGKRQRIGDVISEAKNNLGPYDTNKLNFALLGDPALLLSYPEFLVLTDSINNTSVFDEVDTLKAFSKITVSGFVAYDDSTCISDFNGIVYPHVYDKSVEVATLGNEGVVPFEYNEQKNIIFKGKAKVEKGRFSFSFIVPKDISYSIGRAKISYYAENGYIDAKGECRNVFIGGTDNSVEMDYEGPEVALYMNNNQFKDGGITNSEPVLYAVVNDENGINTTGTGIGHDIVAILDHDNYNPLILNDYYESAINDYRSGIIKYPLNDLEEGEHFLDLKVWDVFNNSSDASVSFVVKLSDNLILEKLICFPNPATGYTYIQYTHNFPDEEHQVLLEVFNMSGQLIHSVARTQYQEGFVSEAFEWDLRSSSGSYVSSGVYPYRLRVTTSGGTSIINQKLIIIR